MSAAFNIALPGSLNVLPQPAQTWTLDDAGGWVRETRQLWRDERGWHDRPFTENSPAHRAGEINGDRK